MFLTNEIFHSSKKQTNIGLLWNDNEKELNANEYYVRESTMTTIRESLCVLKWL